MPACRGCRASDGGCVRFACSSGPVWAVPAFIRRRWWPRHLPSPPTRAGAWDAAGTCLSDRRCRGRLRLGKGRDASPACGARGSRPSCAWPGTGHRSMGSFGDPSIARSMACCASLGGGLGSWWPIAWPRRRGVGAWCRFRHRSCADCCEESTTRPCLPGGLRRSLAFRSRMRFAGPDRRGRPRWPGRIASGGGMPVVAPRQRGSGVGMS